VTQVANLNAISRRERRHRALGWTAVAATAATLALAAAGCGGGSSTSASSSPGAGTTPAAGSSSPASTGPWKLIVATVAGGLDLNSTAISSGAYNSFKPNLTSVNKNIGSAGHAASAVFGVYNLKAQTSPTEVPPLLIYEGLNGTFNPQAIISKVEASVSAGTFHTVAPGPHGGDAVCGSSGSGATAEDVCIWATSTDYATLFAYGKATKAVTSLADLMVSMRNQLEVPK
jgi:hypothetical protein